MVRYQDGRAKVVWGVLLAAGAIGAALAAEHRGRAEDLRRWDDGSVLPDGQGVNLWPGVDLSGRDLAFVDLHGRFLERASFAGTRLQFANLRDAHLVDVDWSGADLTGAQLTGANLGVTHAPGLQAQQLASTASYQEKNLTGIRLWNGKLSGWDFREQNLTDASFAGATLLGTNFSSAHIAGADFSYTTERGWTAAQLASTASYQLHQLPGVRLLGNDLAEWDFRHQNLRGANLYGATVRGGLWHQADIEGANWGHTTAGGWSPEQLYSTLSYQQRQLHNVGLTDNDLSGWNFQQIDLTGSDLSRSHLRGTDFRDAEIERARFAATTNLGWTAAQLYQTASYQRRSLRHIDLSDNDLTGWNLSGVDLSGASLSSAHLFHTDFRGALVRRTNLSNLTWRGFSREQLASTASYQQQDLRGIDFSSNDLSGWDLRGQRLHDTNWQGVNLAGTDLRGADLRAAVEFWPTATTRWENVIQPDGRVAELNLTSGETWHTFPDGGGLSVWGEPRNPVPLKIHGPIQLAESSRWTFHIPDVGWSEPVHVHAELANLSEGTLELVFDQLDRAASEQTPRADRRWQLFAWEGEPGPLTKFAQIIVPPRTRWDLSRLYLDGSVELLSRFAADFNLDGSTDQQDLAVLVNHWTGDRVTEPTRGLEHGDLDGDHDVDSHDLLMFLSEWSGSSPLTSVQPSPLLDATDLVASDVRAVSEPTVSGVWIVAGLAALRFVGRARRLGWPRMRSDGGRGSHGRTRKDTDGEECSHGWTRMGEEVATDGHGRTRIRRRGSHGRTRKDTDGEECSHGRTRKDTDGGRGSHGRTRKDTDPEKR